ncbi:hypothetical protein KPLM21_680045 [Klebsiella pneumoniae]|nr:hypothetical protein KPLM21_680045 [Klebsiella pneumoniae]
MHIDHTFNRSTLSAVSHNSLS